MKTPLQAPQRREDAQPASKSAETPKRAERPSLPETANLQLDVVRRTRKAYGRL